MPVAPIVKEITCVIAGILVILDINNPLTKLCPAGAKTTITSTSGIKATSTSTSKVSGVASTVSIGSTTSVSLGPSTTLTVPSTVTTSTSAGPTSTSTSSSTSTSTSTTIATTSITSSTPTTTSTTPTSTTSTPSSTSSATSTSTLLSTDSAATSSTSTSTDPATTISAPNSTTTTSVTPTTSSADSITTTSTSSTLSSSSTSAQPSSTAFSAFSCPADIPLSCHNTTAVADTCCFDYPGGLVLQTQFWDTNPASGPNNSWTIHGLWPDNCDGSYQQYCDESRQYTNISQIIQSFGDQSLLDYMNTYWTSNSGTAESFWEHEWGKHGTCMSTFDTECYPNYVPTQEVPDFFNRTVTLYQTLPSYDWLAAAGITPSTTATYTLAQIQTALSSQHGGQVYLGCTGSGNNQLDEIWYYYYVQGSIQNGNFVPTDMTGSSSCPNTGILYYPKGYVPPTTSTTTTASATSATTASATSTPTAAPFSVAGYIYVSTNGTQNGFMISGGKWYTAGGTPATYTPTASTDGSGSFTLKSSKGPCAVNSTDSSLACASGLAASTFTADSSGNLVYGGSNIWGAAAVPTGTQQGTVYAGAVGATEPVTIQLYWAPKS